MALLEETYPGQSKAIQQARLDGLSDEEIQGEIQSFIRDQSRAGQPVERIQRKLGQGQPGTLERLATGSVGDVAEFGLKVAAAPAQFVAKTLEPFTPLPGLMQALDQGPESLPQVQLPSGETAIDMGALLDPNPRLVSHGFEAAIEGLRKIDPGLSNLVQASMAQAPFIHAAAPGAGAGLRDLIAGRGFPGRTPRAPRTPEEAAREAQTVEAGRRFVREGPGTLETGGDTATRTPAELAREAEQTRILADAALKQETQPRVEVDTGLAKGTEIAAEVEKIKAESAVQPVTPRREVSVEPGAGVPFDTVLQQLGYTKQDIQTIPFRERVRLATERIPKREEPVAPVVDPVVEEAAKNRAAETATEVPGEIIPETAPNVINPTDLRASTKSATSIAEETAPAIAPEIKRPGETPANISTTKAAEPAGDLSAASFADLIKKGFGSEIGAVGKLTPEQLAVETGARAARGEMYRRVKAEAEKTGETLESAAERLGVPVSAVRGLRAENEQAGGGGGGGTLSGRGGPQSVLPERLRRTPEQIRQEAGVPFTPSRQKIVSDLSSLLEVPIRYGKVQAKNVGGFFKVKPEVIRTKFAQDVEVASHEVGHFLEKSLFKTTKEMAGGKAQGLTGAAFRAFRDELEPIATKHNKSSSPVVEGFAEFVRRYVTHDAEARRVAPRFYKFFDEFLTEKHPDVRSVLLNARKDYNTFNTVPATGRVRAHISRMPEKTKWSAKDAGQRFYSLALDQLAPIARVKNELLRGRKISADTDPELLARTFAGWSRKADLFVKKGPRSFETLEKVGPGLDEITRPIRDRWEDFWDYSAARRVLFDIEPRSRVGDLKGTVEQLTGLSSKDWKEAFDHYDSPEFRGVFEKVRQFQNQNLDYLAKSYGMSEQQVGIIKLLNDNYVPLHRVMDDPNFPVERGPVSGGGTFGNQPSAIKRFKGSQRQPIDPAESVIKNTFSTVNLADRNAVVKSMVDLARKTEGAGKFVEDVPFDRKPTSFQISEIKKTLDELGVELTPEQLEQTATIFRANKGNVPANHVTFWENGKQRMVRLDPELFKSMQRLDKEGANALVKVLSVPANLLRVGATTTPEFALRNPVRDQWSVAINTGLGIKAPYFSARGLFNAVKQTPLYEDWLASGGAQSSLVKLSRAEIIKRAAEMGRDESTARTLIRHPWQSLRLLSQLTEEATRVGVFEAAQRGKARSKASLIEAGAASREASLDFQRMGAKTQAVNQITAFWNANLQGLDKVRRVATENPAGFAARVGIGITLPSVYLALSQMDDARWKEVPQWQKDTAWVVLTGDKVTDEQFAQMTPEEKRDLYRNTIWRIPKPFELGVVFGSIPERIIEWMGGQHKGDIGSVLLQSLGTGIGSSLVPLPTAVAPFLENWANWSNFTGRPVVPRSLEDLEPGLQAKPQTTALSKKIGEAINYSPAKIDNLIRGFGGGLGILGAEAASSLMDTVGVVDLPDRPTGTLADIPGIRGFAVRFPTSQADSIETFWEKYADSQEKVKSYKRLIADNRAAKAEEYYQDNRQLIENSKGFGRGAKAMRDYSKAIGAIFKSRELSSEQKRDAIDLLMVENIDVAREMLKALYPDGTQSIEKENP